MESEIENLLNQFKELICWSTLAGSGTGSIFTLGFGKKIPRKNPILNSHLTTEQQTFDSEYSLMVWCFWSLYKEKDLVCDCNSSNEKDGQMVVGLKKLIGKKIKRIRIHEKTFDLEIDFDSGFRLLIIADGYELYGNDSNNYVFFFPEFTMSVTTKLELEKKSRV